MRRLLKEDHTDFSILGQAADEFEFISLDRCSDGCFYVDKDDVVGVFSTQYKKVEFIFFQRRVLAHVKSSPLRKGDVGTLGEFSPKPHPWLYAECSRAGLGIAAEKRFHVVGIEDSGAGICSLELAGFAPIGITGGNIIESG
jgi:hypothetical protein